MEILLFVLAIAGGYGAWSMAADLKNLKRRVHLLEERVHGIQLRKDIPPHQWEDD